ncbi:MAG: hypothetical protein ACKV19_16955 [Verrucomicrobiales bacterium]
MRRKRPIRSLIGMAAALCGGAGAGQSAMLTWYDQHSGGPLDFLYEPYGRSDSSYDLSYSNTWDIKPDGFDPAIHGIDGIKVWFAFADDRPGEDPTKERTAGNGGDAEEYVDIALRDNPNQVLIWDDLEVDGAHPSSDYAYYSMVLDPTLHASIFSDLAADGLLKYTVALEQFLADTGSESKYGEDTYLKVTKINAWYDDTPRHVPEGGAGLGLLALSLAGMVQWRRKLK